MALDHPCEDCQPLKIPYPDASDQGDPAKMEQNWKELERYIWYFITNCLCCNCGGGG